VGYDLGDTVPITGTCRDATGAATNATTVTLTVQLPDGSTTTPTVTNPPATTGLYTYDYVPAVEGHYQWWLRTTGPTAALTGGFDVEPAFGPLIISLTAAREQINPRTTVADEELREIIAAAGAMLEGPMFANHAIMRRTVTETRTIDPRSVHYQYGTGQVFYLSRAPVISVTSIVRVDGSGTWSPSQMSVDADTGRVVMISGSRLWGLVTITYVVGMTTIPPEYRMAGRLCVQDLWDTQSSRYGRGGATSYNRSGGDMVDQLSPATVSRVRDLIGEPWLVVE
jgi:hypothetical protein